MGRGALRNNPRLCLLHHVGPEPRHITACTTAVTVCIFDMLTDAEKEQVLRISATILFYPPLGKKKKWTVVN